MSTAVETAKPVPWWREPTKDQWYAFGAAWVLGRRPGAPRWRPIWSWPERRHGEQDEQGASSDKPGGAFFVASRAPGSCATGR